MMRILVVLKVWIFNTGSHNWFFPFVFFYQLPTKIFVDSFYIEKFFIRVLGSYQWSLTDTFSVALHSSHAPLKGVFLRKFLRNLRKCAKKMKIIITNNESTPIFFKLLLKISKPRWTLWQVSMTMLILIVGCNAQVPLMHLWLIIVSDMTKVLAKSNGYPLSSHDFQ